MPDSAALRDHVAVVTGAGSGLGAHVVVNDLPAEALAAQLAAILARIPAGRLGQADEVAELVRCLVCDATCSFGEILPISGGWSA